MIAFLRSDDPRVAPVDLDPPGESRPSFLTKALSHGPFAPLPYPTQPINAPPVSDRVAYGRYLVYALDCYSCHASDFKSVNHTSPEKTPGYLAGGNPLRDATGHIIPSANLTPDEETGIGRWSEADFLRAMKNGLTPGGTLHYPMVAMPELDDNEVVAIYAYLRTVPKIHKAIARTTEAPAEEEGNEGKRLFRKYGCVACHGENGTGPVADVRRANDDYPTDESLRAWLDNAPRLKPGTKMPAWKGVIADADYAPLMAHVRSLSRGNGAHAANP
jgi:mono/diheme cytochrome c family protein